VRDRIRRRTQRILNANFPALREWLDAQGDLFRYVPPRAGAIAYVRYATDIASGELALRLKDERDVLIVPGEHFGMDHYLRIGYGVPKPELAEALDRIRRTLESVGAARQPARR
jgi:aspartate/methionine/tyrosine aminotransferase